MDINELLKVLVDKRGSDLHLNHGYPPMMERDGTLEPLTGRLLVPEDVEAMMKEITPPPRQQQLQTTGGTDFSYRYSPEVNFRINVCLEHGGFKITARLIPQQVKSFEQLGLPTESILSHLRRVRGLILVTGPTGSGKTTTLASCIDWLNTNVAGHIITIEDPIEYFHARQGKKGLLTQREIPVDTPDFPSAVRLALRMAPKVILVGEMRDLETMRAATTAAETGHLVFSTTHTTGAAQTVDRIVNAFPANEWSAIRQTLSLGLESVISQLLIPRKDGRGRVAAFEIMHKNNAVANLIREGKTERITSVIQTGQKDGMMTMDMSLALLMTKGLISGEEALARASDQDYVRRQAFGNVSEEH